MKFYYIHIHSSDVYHDKKNNLILDSIIKDSIFQANGFWGFDNLSLDFLEEKKFKIKYNKIENINIGNNLENDLEWKGEFPSFLYKLKFEGIAGQDDIGVYKNSYLIVSEYALKRLRKIGVEKAESNLIKSSLEKYFETNSQYFWMDDKIKDKFIKNFISRK